MGVNMEKFENDGSWKPVSGFGSNSTIYARGNERILVNEKGSILCKYAMSQATKGNRQREASQSLEGNRY